VIRYEDIQEKVEAYNPEADFDLLRRAYVVSAREHRGQTRRSGEPYLIHPLEVAGILADLHLDMTCIVVGLLHDVAEDTLLGIDTIEEYFGRDIAHIVKGVTKLSKLDFRSKEEQQAENLRKMFLAMVDDVRVILVKLADRLHNMRTLGFLAPAKQREIARETRDIYAPIAHRLGMGRIKSELEDLCLKFLETEGYEDLMRELERKRKVSADFIEETHARIRDAVTGQGIEAEITGRLKSAASIKEKMERQSVGVEEIIIHSLWRPVPGRFRDYVAMPKPNGYQSLHTSVMSSRGQSFEVQIRTPEMHRVAEEGIAAHWSYKEGTGGAGSDDVHSARWLRQYLDLLQEVKDPREFLQMARMDLYPDEVYAFTPKGDVKSFPRGATVLDFAYAIHTEIGHQCIGARVNGRFVPVRKIIANGDIVEILTSPSRHPSRDSLSFAHTSRARSKIRQWLNIHERRKSLAVGRDSAEREFRKYRFNPKRHPARRLAEALKEMGFESYEDFLISVGFGKTSPAALVTRLEPALRPEERPESRLSRAVKRALGVGAPHIQVAGVDDVMISIAACCSPIPGDEIVGYITRGRGVSVHSAGCNNVESLLYGSDRRIDVAWSRKGGKDAVHPVRVQIVTDDKQGILARITNAISEDGTNIKTVDARVSEDRQGMVTLVLDIRDTEHLEKVLRRLRRTEGVRSAHRHEG